jgi:major membrane immunogen (membrane-anchored lipoprotein)
MRITPIVCASTLVLSTLLVACGQRDSASGTSPSGATGGGTASTPATPMPSASAASR